MAADLVCEARHQSCKWMLQVWKKRERAAMNVILVMTASNREPVNVQNGPCGSPRYLPTPDQHSSFSPSQRDAFSVMPRKQLRRPAVKERTTKTMGGPEQPRPGESYGRQQTQLRAHREVIGTLIGRTISHYRILARLGSGGMAVVYRAKDTKLRREVALKVASSDTLSEQDLCAGMLREACAGSVLSHPNLCAVYDLGEYQGRTVHRDRVTGRPNTEGNN